VRRGGSKRTEARVDGGLDARGLADHDGRVGVVLLHGGVAPGEEVPARGVSVGWVGRMGAQAAGVGGRGRGRVGCWAASGGRIPGGGAGLAGLAEEEAQLLEAGVEGVLGGHGGGQLAIGNMMSSGLVGRWLTLLQLQKAALPSCV
jgi:hypothetical protein